MISTHILDTSLGNPAAHVTVELAKYVNDQWLDISTAKTNMDGRIAFECAPIAGTYRLKFKIEDYLKQQMPDKNVEPFFIVAPVVFNIQDVSRKYHIPLLLNPFGYSIYRGS